MSTPIELRFKWPAGEAKFILTQSEALKAAVALRKLGLGLGLTLQKGSVMVTTQTAMFTQAEAVIRKDVRGKML
jgi:hypothetical protein